MPVWRDADLQHWGTLVASCLLAAILLTLAGCNPPSPSLPPVATGQAEKTRIKNKKTVNIEGLRPKITAFCGDCHATPNPASFDKSSWEREVARGFALYRESGRFDLVEPRESDVVDWFAAQAPDKIAFAEPPPASHPLPVRFRRQVLAPPEGSSVAVSSLLWDTLGDSQGELLFADMYSGEVARIRTGDRLATSVLGNGGNPAHIQPADLDGDGRVDYVLSDLGSFFPEDHQKGRVVWLHEEGTRGWQVDVLASGLGRVAHTAVGDFDGDGQTDIMVAEFGWHTTGRILLLRRSEGSADAPRFEPIVVDPRHGASHVLAIDWDNDGDLDFVALIAQEHEKVELFINDGHGTFSVETIYAAPDPAFGSSGIELVDLDGDGDLDVVYTNGDSMDSSELKPFHAVRWLENRGEFPFTEHTITAMPGVYKAIVGDFDKDGDLDIVARGFPPAGKKIVVGNQPLSVLVFLEQTEPGMFARHVMRAGVGGAALVAGDFDGDGDLDLASGTFAKEPEGTWVAIWWNDGRNTKHPASPAE